MRNVYLVAAIIGFALPNYLVLLESLESGNILLWVHFMDTVESSFSNRISTIFMIDLSATVTVFLIWVYAEYKRYSLQKFWVTLVITMLFGLAGSLPLFLFWREGKLSQ